jgi:hypothetical protein
MTSGTLVGVHFTGVVQDTRGRGMYIGYSPVFSTFPLMFRLAIFCHENGTGNVLRNVFLQSHGLIWFYFQLGRISGYFQSPAGYPASHIQYPAGYRI